MFFQKKEQLFCEIFKKLVSRKRVVLENCFFSVLFPATFSRKSGHLLIKAEKGGEFVIFLITFIDLFIFVICWSIYKYAIIKLGVKGFKQYVLGDHEHN